MAGAPAPSGGGGRVIIIKKKGKGHAAHHGGSWKVAYADFVTAMMTFFIVMWIMGLSADKRAVIAGYFQDPMGFMKNEPRSKSIITLPGATKPKLERGKSDPSKQEQKAIE